MYGLESITNEEQTNMEGIISMYGKLDIFVLFLGRGRNRFKQERIRLGHGYWYGSRGLNS